MIFILTGVICVRVKPQRQNYLVKPPCNVSHVKLGYCRYVNPENSSEQTWFPYRTGVICGIITPKDKTADSQTPLHTFNF